MNRKRADNFERSKLTARIVGAAKSQSSGLDGASTINTTWLHRSRQKGPVRGGPRLMRR